MFDKGPELFPIKDRFIYTAHCSISPLFRKGADRAADLLHRQSREGVLLTDEYMDILTGLHQRAAELLNTSSENLALVKNTSEALGMIAGGYPFQPGDEIISYVHEYPANHYPWKLQEQRGVYLKLLPDRNKTGVDIGGRPCAWSMADLKEMVTEKTRMVAISHVQFSSGYAADLKKLGKFCRRHDIHLVVDAAQSLGCLPVSPEEAHIDALAASTWKWLLGPIGTGLMYTSPSFREKLGHVMTGAEQMQQGPDFLDHTWQPWQSARRFEYSTSPLYLAAALEACISDIFLKYEVEEIRKEVFRLQDIFLNKLDRNKYIPVLFQEENRSGIISLISEMEPEELQDKLRKQNIICSPRSGYLRLAPHFCTSEEEVEQVAEALNRL
ncbi:MAG: aminotransferase class V-fold PLP-dependent enzyme [Desulfurivibrionaceae bacterium]